MKADRTQSDHEDECSASSNECDALMALLRRSARQSGTDVPELAGCALTEVMTSLEETEPDGNIGSDRPNPDMPISEPDRFLILGLHGQGGIGQVFHATDRDFNRDVAIKRMKPELANDPVVHTRFQREAEITGKLEHPGIIPVYARGYDSLGRSFYVMRLVRGDTLKEAIHAFHKDCAPNKGPSEASGLRLRQLLGRFVDVCHTMDYVHNKKVIHRDLKPTNILLGPYGETLVVDWGLAKELSPGAGEGNDPGLQSTVPGSTIATGETAAGSPLGTPEYMSPEQAEGRWSDVGVASDIYSLGATYYAILTGRSPFHGISSSDEVLAKVKRAEFPRPRRVNPSLCPALEAICLKAMELNPRNRYTSARALAEEVERWLAGEPILVWREPLFERARRWLVQRRTLVLGLRIASMIALGAVGALVAVLIWSNQRLALTNARDEALIHELQNANRQVEEARNRADARVELALGAVENFRTAVSNHIDVRYRPDLAPLRRALLQAPFEFYRNLRADLDGSEQTRAETREQLVRAICSLAETMSEVDSQSNALHACEEAIGIIDQLALLQPQITFCRAAKARMYTWIGNLHRGTGERESGFKALHVALSLQHELVHDEPDDPDHIQDMARTYDLLGRLSADSGRIPEALAFLREANERQRALSHQHPKSASYRAQLATTLNVIGMILHQIGQNDQALASYEEAIRVEESAERDDSSVPLRSRANLANYYFNSGNLMLDMGRRTDAVARYERARQIQEEITRDNPGVSEFRAELARIEGSLALIRSGDGQTEAALASLIKVRDLQRITAREQPNATRFQVDLATTLANIGDILALKKRLREALSNLEEARGLLEHLIAKVPGNASWSGLLGLIWENTGALHEELGQKREALEAYRHAVNAQQSAIKQVPQSVQYQGRLINHLRRLARMQRACGHPADAVTTTMMRHALSSKTADELYETARELSACIPLLDKQLDRPEESNQNLMLVQRIGDQASGMLRQAFRTGFRDVHKLRTEPDFSSIRARADFESLELDMAFPPNPFGQ